MREGAKFEKTVPYILVKTQPHPKIGPYGDKKWTKTIEPRKSVNEKSIGRSILIKMSIWIAFQLPKTAEKC